MKIQLMVEMSSEPATEDGRSTAEVMAELLNEASEDLREGAVEGSWETEDGRPLAVWWLEEDSGPEALDDEACGHLALAIVDEMDDEMVREYVVDSELERIQSLEPAEQHKLWDEYFEAEETAANEDEDETPEPN